MSPVPANKTSIELPRPTLERLPVYHREVAAVVAADDDYISSAELGKRLGFDEAQVRRDLSFVYGKGKPGLGYEAVELLNRLEDVLGFNNLADAVLVGAGNLGLALFSYPGFRVYGMDIVAVFDSDPDKIGQTISSIACGTQEIMAIGKLSTLVHRMRIQLGIIAVPASEAQAVADMLIAAGIKAIWNFAPVNLRVPGHVVVRHEDMAVGLATLQYHLSNHAHRAAHPTTSA